ncbi:hypothetical protein [Nocardia cyriacigeorgica]|uniref:hypothetical protein n=1 Tax=Nocardia cyriacigeorgica TaxID=135487 RepID=UPI002454329A|nr:hypothetical protein [Nocardia cyriacigeorgica]
MNDFHTAPPADCQMIDFRAECEVVYPSSVQVPVTTTTQAEGVPEVTPEAPPIPGADSGPLSWLDDLHLPDPTTITGEGVLDALSVAGVFGGSVAAVAAGALAASWWWAWTPVRLRNFAIGSACVLPGSAALLEGWNGPQSQVFQAVNEIVTGAAPQGAATAAIATVPAGWAVASLALAKFNDQLETRGLKSPTRTERMLWARRRREMAAATRLSATALPLCAGTVSPQPVIGRAATTSSTAPARSVLGRMRGHNESLFTVPWLAMREHFVAVGNPGSGKTTMMIRAIIAFWATAWRMHGQWWRNDRPGRPLAIIIDVKGARDARKTFGKVKASAMAIGIPEDRIANWPDDVELSLWQGEAPEISTRIEGLVGAGMSTDNVDPAEAYYLQMRKAVIHLVVDAPDPDNDLEDGEAPPRTFFEYLARMNKAELERRWAGYADELAAINAVTASQKNPVLDGERTAMLNLARELGSAFDGDALLTDFDVVYCCLEGITAPLVAQAQFGALVAMLQALAGTDHGRCIQLFCDEFAQVCGNSGAARIVELLRSAGIGSGWFSQSWMGLGADDDQRHRLVDSCSGGIFAMRSNSAGALAEKIGTRRKSAISRKVIGGGKLGDEGNVQIEDSFIVGPAVMADFGPGDIVHVRSGQAKFGHVSELNSTTLRPLPGLAKSTIPAESVDLTKGAA